MAPLWCRLRGNGGLDLAWDNGATGGTLSGIVEGAYTLTVTDANSCRADTTIEIDCNGEPDIVPYQFISPNGDGLNEVWIIDHINYYQKRKSLCTTDGVGL